MNNQEKRYWDDEFDDSELNAIADCGDALNQSEVEKAWARFSGPIKNGDIDSPEVFEAAIVG
jgi:hypothetical protein